jgi:hypothetical protein
MAEVTCRVSEFTARAFGRRFRAPMEIEPARFTLASGAAQDVALRLTLDPSVFASGADYVATLQISGAGERDLIVQLMAHADSRAEHGPASTPTPAAPPPAPAPASTSSRSKSSGAKKRKARKERR